eukprot:Rmarinus@m.19948
MDSDDENDGPPLCCCEFYNSRGERKHMLQCICDCEYMDKIIDDLCRGAQPSGSASEAVGELHDRCRLPWFGGARRLNLPFLLGLMLPPITFSVSSINILTAFLTLGFLTWYFLYSSTRALKLGTRNYFFVAIVASSCVTCYLTFMSQMKSQGDEILVVLSTISFLLMMYFFQDAVTTDPGRVRGTGSENQISSGTKISASGGLSGTEPRYCATCDIERPPRAKHCRLCGYCVHLYDHHCVWINNCVGAYNHNAFLATQVLFLVNALLYVSVMEDRVESMWSDTKGGALQLLFCRTGFIYATMMYTKLWWLAVATLVATQVYQLSLGVTTNERVSSLRGRAAYDYVPQVMRSSAAAVCPMGCLLPAPRACVLNWAEYLRTRVRPTWVGQRRRRDGLQSVPIEHRQMTLAV